MRLGSLVLAGYALISAQGAVAQSGSSATKDPISGTWTGYMGPDESSRNNITVKLKFDGSSAVSGTITGPPQPGQIKTGSFDAKSGVLKLDVAVQGQGNVGFEGTLAKGTITGQVHLGGQTGVFRITRGVGEVVPPSPSPPPPRENDPPAAARRSFTEVSGWVSRSAELVPADKYTYRPAPTVRTFGQLIGHVADAYNYYCARAAGRNVQWSDAIEKGATDKATLAPKLKQALDGCNTVYAGAGQIGPLTDNVAHTSLHYGNIITYIRMLGLVPPSS